MATSELDGIQLQQRDLALLRGLFESRVVTAAQAAVLYFEGKQEAARKRLQKLKAVGLINERKRRVNEPSVLFLTRKAFQLLRDKGELSQYPPLSAAAFERRAHVSSLTLRHELEVMDVKSAFHSAIAGTGQVLVAEFSTWPVLSQFEAYRERGAAPTLVRPDGFIRVHERELDGGLSEHTFFLEVDRSTETQDTLVTRAGGYLDYYTSGGFAVRNGGTRADFKAYPFRVLMVFKSEERRNNTAERLLQRTPPILTQVWLSTFAEVTTNPLGEIWIRPADYRDATRGTAFDVEQAHRTVGYHRQPERERVVQGKIKRSRILE